MGAIETQYNPDEIGYTLFNILVTAKTKILFLNITSGYGFSITSGPSVLPEGTHGDLIYETLPTLMLEISCRLLKIGPVSTHLKFKAQETNSDIVITCASTPAAADYVRIDDVFLAQSTLAVSHFTTPTALSASGDEPEFPLNVLDGMLISAAIAEHGDDIGNPTMIRNAEEKMRRLHSEFVKLIEGQGKHQIAQASDYYLSQGVEGFELDIS